MAKNIDNTNLGYLKSKMDDTYWPKTDVVPIAIDNTPTANSNNLVKSGGVYDAVAAKYTKPANGIPASDLEAGVIPSVPVTDVTVGGTSVVSNGTAAVPAIPDAVEANPTVPSGTTPTTLQNVKVGNSYYSVPQGSSTTLSTDVVTDKTSNLKASTPKSVYDFVKPASQNSQPAGGLEPGILYNLGVLTGTVTIDLATPSDSSVANEYMFSFTAGSTAPTITWPSGITGWAGNCIENYAPNIKAGMFYEVSILNGIGAIMEVEV